MHDVFGLVDQGGQPGPHGVEACGVEAQLEHGLLDAVAPGLQGFGDSGPAFVGGDVVGDYVDHGCSPASPPGDARPLVVGLGDGAGHQLRLVVDVPAPTATESGEGAGDRALCGRLVGVDDGFLAVGAEPHAFALGTGGAVLGAESARAQQCHDGLVDH